MSKKTNVQKIARQRRRRRQKELIELGRKASEVASQSEAQAKAASERASRTETELGEERKALGLATAELAEVKKELAAHLPIPVIEERDGRFTANFDRPGSIGRVKGFYGNFAIIVRALCYILNLGPKGVREIAEYAVLNANYIRKSLEGEYYLKYTTASMHECVFSDKFQKEFGITNLDIAKRLIDYGMHPPTMSFPLIVHGALMIEPTETESKRDLDMFIAAMKAIAREAKENPEILKSAPHVTYVRRLDEVAAAKTPVLRWEKKT